jgi:hypothetical protein
MGACSEKLVVSQPLPLGKDFPKPDGEFVGIVYFLPKTVVAVTGKPVSSSSESKQQAQGSQQPQGSDDAPVQPVPPSPANVANGLAKSAGAGPETASSAGQQYTITPAIMPDQNARFLLKYSPGHFEDDNVTLEIDTNGLLKTSNANSTGRQGEILAALAQTATAIMTLGMGAPVSGVPGLAGEPAVPTPQGCTQVATTFSVTFELAELLTPQPLPDCSFIGIDWHAGGIPNIDPKAVVVPPTPTAGPPSCGFSVCYRTLMPVRATIYAAEPAGSARTTQGRAIARASFVAVDPELTAGVNLQSAPLVTRKHTLSFSSGLLTSAMIDDPSVTLAIAKLPITIITALLSGPASVLSLKVTNVTDAANLATQQKALLDAQNALIKDITASRSQVALPVAGSGAGH